MFHSRYFDKANPVESIDILAVKNRHTHAADPVGMEMEELVRGIKRSNDLINYKFIIIIIN